MEQVLILLALAGVTQAFLPATESKCNATQNTSLCSVTVEGSVYIQVMTDARGHRLQCKKLHPTGLINVFTLKREKVTIHLESLRNRTTFFIHNGTLKITNVEKNDSGQYTIKDFDSNGILVRNINITLEVQENIWPIVIIGCSAVGGWLIVVMVVVCCCICCRRRRRRPKQVKIIQSPDLFSELSELDHY